MSEQLIPADLDVLPLGSVIPMARDKPEEGWLLFNGQTLYSDDHPELYDLISAMSPEASEIFDGWGAEIDHQARSVTLPDIDPKTVLAMMWGVEIQGAPELALAMKAVRSEV